MDLFLTSICCTCIKTWYF